MGWCHMHQSIRPWRLIFVIDMNSTLSSYLITSELWNYINLLWFLFVHAWHQRPLARCLYSLRSCPKKISQRTTTDNCWIIASDTWRGMITSNDYIQVKSIPFPEEKHSTLSMLMLIIQKCFSQGTVPLAGSSSCFRLIVSSKIVAFVGDFLYTRA